MKEYYGAIKRCLWTFLFIMLIQLGNSISLSSFQSNKISSFDIYNFFINITAGNSKNLTLFSIGLGPYMISLIIWNSLSIFEINWVKNISVRQMGFIQRILTFIFSILQAVIICFRFKGEIVFNKLMYFSQMDAKIIMAIFLISGGMIVTYIAELNRYKGVGKQMVIILPGLLLNVPSLLLSNQLKDNFFSSSVGGGFIIILTMIFVYITLYLYKSEYRIKIKQTSINSNFNYSYIPIRLLISGAMPFIFSATVFSLPQLLLLNKSLENSFISNLIVKLFTYSSVLGIVTYGFILSVLIFAFGHMNFRVFDIAKALQKSGDYIFDVLPGLETEKYIRKRLNMILIIGNIYMLIVSLLPMIIGLRFPEFTNLSFYFGSVFMIIIIVDGLKEDITYIFSKRNYKIF